MMWDFVVGLLGAIGGLLFTKLYVIGVQLPWQLQWLESQRTKGFGVPLSLAEKQDRARNIRLIYLTVFPVGLSAMGAFLAIRFFGSGEWVH